REDVLRDLLATEALVTVGLNAQQLLLVIPLVERLGLVEPFVTLQPNEVGAQCVRQHLADLGLARPGGAFDQQRPLEREGEIEHGLDRIAGDVTRARQAVADNLASDLHRAIIGRVGPSGQAWGAPLRRRRGGGRCLARSRRRRSGALQEWSLRSDCGTAGVKPTIPSWHDLADADRFTRSSTEMTDQ